MAKPGQFDETAGDRDREGAMRPWLPAARAALALAIALAPGPAAAEVPIDEVGHVETLATPPSAHWAWASDLLLNRTALVDLDSGDFLGMISVGWGTYSALFPASRPEIYVPETFYSRGSRGERTDVVTIYDEASLAPVGEVEIPPRRAINTLTEHNYALSDDERFVAVFNMTPGTSLSIVDVVERTFVGEILTPGCSLVYPAGPRRFLMLCADGSMLGLQLDESGRLLARERSEPFFDPLADPVTEKAARYGDTWIFVSFEGWAHPVDVSGETLRAGERWSLLGERDRADSWRIGGAQHLAVHQASGRLYSLVHQGGVDTHKDPGTELWIYDLAERRRVDRIALHNPGFTFMGQSLEFGRGWVWPFDRLYDALLAIAPNPGIGQITVTQDAEPLLVTGAAFSGSLGVYDALTGEFLRRVFVGNLTTQTLQTPWSGERAH